MQADDQHSPHYIINSTLDIYHSLNADIYVPVEFSVSLKDLCKDFLIEVEKQYKVNRVSHVDTPSQVVANIQQSCPLTNYHGHL